MCSDRARRLLLLSNVHAAKHSTAVAWLIQPSPLGLCVNKIIVRGWANLANAKGAHADGSCPPLPHSLRSCTGSQLRPIAQLALGFVDDFSVCCRAVSNRMRTSPQEYKRRIESGNSVLSSLLYLLLKVSLL